MLRNRLLDGQRYSDDKEATSEGSLQSWRCEENGVNSRKRVVVLVDESRQAKFAFLWALSHVVNKFDIVTLLYVVEYKRECFRDMLCSGSGNASSAESKGYYLANSLKALSTGHWPQVEIEVVVLGGDKGPTIVSQVKKLGASLLVLGQKRPSLFQRLFPRKTDGFVDFCIANAECLTLGVSKQSSRTGGYLINTRWHKNFWLLA